MLFPVGRIFLSNILYDRLPNKLLCGYGRQGHRSHAAITKGAFFFQCYILWLVFLQPHLPTIHRNQSHSTHPLGAKGPLGANSQTPALLPFASLTVLCANPIFQFIYCKFIFKKHFAKQKLRQNCFFFRQQLGFL